MEHSVGRIFRDRPLTDEEFERDEAIRREVMEEFPPEETADGVGDGPLSQGLRNAIHESGKSYMQISDQTHISAAMIERFAKGERTIPLEIADRLADALGIHLAGARSALETKS